MSSAPPDEVRIPSDGDAGEAARDADEDDGDVPTVRTRLSDVVGDVEPAVDLLVLARTELAVNGRGRMAGRRKRR